MDLSGHSDATRWSSLLDSSRGPAVARVEDEWVRYVTEMEHRSADAARSAEERIRLHRGREEERLETLRELEVRIAQMSAVVSERELETQQRLSTLQGRIAEREGRLAELERTIHGKAEELGRIMHRLSKGIEETTQAERRLQTLEREEREAKERLIIIQTRGELQLKDYEAKRRAVHLRTNAIVAEAAGKVRRLREAEAELTHKLNLLQAGLQATTDTARALSISTLKSPSVDTKLQVKNDRSYSRSAPSSQAKTFLGSNARHGGILDGDFPKVSPIAVTDLSVMLSQLEDQLKDSLVEEAANEFSRVTEVEEGDRGTDQFLRSPPDSAVMEF